MVERSKLGREYFGRARGGVSNSICPDWEVSVARRPPAGRNLEVVLRKLLTTLRRAHDAPDGDEAAAYNDSMSFL